MKITSRENPRVKQARSLLQRRGRAKAGRWLVEGVRVLEEAFRHGHPPETIFYTAESGNDARVQNILQRAAQWGIACYEVPARLLAEMSDARTPQGIVAVVPTPRMSGDGFSHQDAVPLVLVIDRIQDPGNLGTMLRTALAVGVTGVALVHGTVDPGHPKAIRSSAGAVFGLPIAVYQPDELIGKLRQNNMRLIALDVRGDVSLYEVPWNEPTALLVGHEAHGPSERLLKDADIIAHIPMPGGGESLNAATAVAVCLYEALRQRAAVH